MSLYLVLYSLQTYEYMGPTTVTEEIDLVEAESPKEAESKLEKIYKDKSEPYGIEYCILGANVKPIIR